MKKRGKETQQIEKCDQRLGRAKSMLHFSSMVQSHGGADTLRYLQSIANHGERIPMPEETIVQG